MRNRLTTLFLVLALNCSGQVPNILDSISFGGKSYTDGKYYIEKLDHEIYQRFEIGTLQLKLSGLNTIDSTIFLTKDSIINQQKDLILLGEFKNSQCEKSLNNMQDIYMEAWKQSNDNKNLYIKELGRKKTWRLVSIILGGVLTGTIFILK